MKKTWGLVAGLGLLVSIFLVGQRFYSKPLSAPQSVVSVAPQRVATVQVDFGEGKIATVSAEKVAGLSVYEVLEGVAKQEEWKVDVKQYDFGVFVTGINGVGGDTAKGWLYYVNGKAGTVAADQQLVVDGDKVEWKYEAVKN